MAAVDGGEAPRVSPTNSAQGYFALSRQPLQALIALLPLLIAYEYGAWQHLHGQEVLWARSMLRQGFDLFGVTGYYLPGLIVVVALGCWHLVSSYPNVFRWEVYVLMWVESAILALPLLGLAILMLLYPQPEMPLTAQADPGGGGPMADLSWEAKLTVSIGAGIYEELVFRLMGIVLLYGLFVDMIGMGKITGSALAILLSSVAFAQAHFLPGTPFRWNLYLFFCLAGVYLAGVYIARGFGIAAGAHALYDVIVVALSSMEPAAG